MTASHFIQQQCELLKQSCSDSRQFVSENRAINRKVRINIDHSYLNFQENWMGKNEFVATKLNFQEDSTVNNTHETRVEGNTLRTEETSLKQKEMFCDGTSNQDIQNNIEQNIDIINNNICSENNRRSGEMHKKFGSNHSTLSVDVEISAISNGENYLESECHNACQILHSTPVTSTNHSIMHSSHVTKKELFENEDYFVYESQSVTEILGSTPAIICETIDTEYEGNKCNQRSEEIDQRKNNDCNDFGSKTDDFKQTSQRQNTIGYASNSNIDDYACILNDSYNIFLEHDYCVRTSPTVEHASEKTCNQIADCNQVDVLKTKVNNDTEKMTDKEVISLNNKYQVDEKSDEYLSANNKAENKVKTTTNKRSSKYCVPFPGAGIFYEQSRKQVQRQPVIRNEDNLPLRKVNKTKYGVRNSSAFDAIIEVLVFSYKNTKSCQKYCEDIVFLHNAVTNIINVVVSFATKQNFRNLYKTRLLILHKHGIKRKDEIFCGDNIGVFCQKSWNLIILSMKR